MTDTQQATGTERPKSKLPDIRKLQEWHSEDLRWRDSWRPEAERLEGMIHAYQWTKDEEQELENQGRKPMRSPHAAKVIWSMVGWQAQNKSEIKYLPRGASDEGVATARTQIAKYWWDQNQAEFALSDCRMAQYIGPMGWLFVGLRMDDPNKEPTVIETVPWREMLWDRYAKRPDLSDCKRVTRERWLALDEAQDLYPEKAEELKQWVTSRRDAAEATNEFGMEVVRERAGDAVGPVSTWDQAQYLYAQRQEVRLVETWYSIKERGHYIELPDGRNVEFDRKSYEHQLAIYQGAIVRPGTINRVYVCTFTGDLILEQMESPYKHGMYPYVPMWGLVDQKGIPYGISRLIEDEQKVINWSTSKLLWIASSRQAFAGPNADRESIAENLAKPDGIVERLNKDDVEIIPQGDMTGLNANLLQNAISNMKEIAGSPDEMRGGNGNAHSGVAIEARQHAAMMQQGRFLDNERRCLVMVGEILMALMDQVMTEEKILRITESNGKLSQVAVNVEDPLKRQQMEQQGLKAYGAITQGQYDCIVTTGNLSESERQAQLENLTQMMQGMDPIVRLALLDLWVDGTDYPNKEEIVKRIQQVQKTQLGGGQPQEPQAPPPDPIRASYIDLPPAAQHAWLVKEGLIDPNAPITPDEMVSVKQQADHAHDAAKTRAGHEHQAAQAANADRQAVLQSAIAHGQQQEQVAQQHGNAQDLAMLGHGNNMEQQDMAAQQAAEQQKAQANAQG